MNPKQFKAAIARQCGFEPLDGDDLDQLYAEEQARQQPDQPNGIRGLPSEEQTEEI
jgi:hypothetical protein